MLTLFYGLIQKLAAICFNLLNVLLAGNLPPFGSVCVIVEDQGNYLIVKRPGGQYVFPGGYMRWKEFPWQCAERECLEETGLRIAIKELIECNPNPSKSITKMSTLTLIYWGTVIGGQLRTTIEGQAIWVDGGELPQRLQRFHRHALEQFLRHRNGEQLE